jgi:hypothetical protein
MQGDSQIIAKLTVLSANQTISLLAQLISSTTQSRSDIYSVEKFSRSFRQNSGLTRKLRDKFIEYGSDKASPHNYHHVYSCLISEVGEVQSLLEIGMGSNNPTVASNMGLNGRPGASLRAFRDVLSSSMRYGAGIDKKILFEESRIRTFFVNQLDQNTFIRLNRDIPGPIDIIIDDGLHSPNANIATVQFATAKLSIGGWCVIEDIPLGAVDVWKVVQTFLPNDSYESYLVETKRAFVFVCRKLK